MVQKLLLRGVIRGISMHTRGVILRIFVAAGFVPLVIQFQNCAPATGSPFSIQSGGSTQSASSVSGPAILSLTLPQNSYSPGAALSAVASVSSSDINTQCQWTIMSGTTLLGTYVGQFSSSSCTMPSTGVAPATGGVYDLTLTVTNSSGQSANSSLTFLVSSGPAPTPVPTPVPIPSVPNCSGTFSVVSGGFPGTLTVVESTTGVVTGSILLKGASSNSITGTCSGSGTVGTIKFSRISNSDQSYVGTFTISSTNASPASMSGTYTTPQIPGTVFTWTATLE